MHRSGTSALTRTFNLLGADLPRNVMGPGLGNEQGHWESSDLVVIHDAYLSAIGSKWDDWREIAPDSFRSSLANDYRQRLLGVLQDDFSKSHFFLVKDPRICRFVPLWLDVLDGFGAAAKIVIPVRNPLETASSLKARDGFAPAKSYLLYLRHLLDAERATRGLPRVFVTYSELLDDWRGLATRVASATGLTWPRLSDRSALEIEHFLSTALRHHASAPDQLYARAEIVDWVKETHDALLRLASGAKADSQLTRLDRVREAFNKASSAFGQALLAEEDRLAAQKERETAQFSTELAAVQSEVQERIREIEALRAEINSRAAEIAALQEVNKRAYEDIEAARSELGAARAQIETLAAGQRDLEAQWHSERESYNGLAQSLNAELQSLGMRLAEQEALATERQVQFEDAQQNILVLTQELEAARQAAHSELNSARLQMDALSAGHRDSEAQWQAERATFAQELETTHNWLREAQAMAQSLAGEIDAAQTELAAERSAHEATRSELHRTAAFEPRLTAAESALESERTLASARQSELDSLRMARDLLQQERDRLAGELGLAQERAAETLRAREALASELAAERERDRLAGELGVAREEAAETLRAREALESELAAERERHAEDARLLQERAAASRAAADTLQQERDRLAGELALAQERAGETLRARDSLASELAAERERHQAEAGRRHAEAAAQIAAQAARADAAARDLAALQAQAQALRTTVAEQAARLTAPPTPGTRLADRLVSPFAALTRRFARWKRSDLRVREWEAGAIRTSRLFSPLWYLQRYPDVAAAGQDPLEHYLAHGAAEDRDPHPLFDSRWYRDSYPQAQAANMSPLAHYATVGVSEGLDPHPLFDTDFYLRNNPDVAAAGVNPLWHYMTQGGFEGRDPHALFDSSWYLQRNPDVAKVRDNPLVHYLTHGWKEGRDPSPEFDGRFYLDAHRDVAEAGTNPLVHYVRHGEGEGRAKHAPEVLSSTMQAVPTLVAMATSEAEILPKDACSEDFIDGVSALFDPVYYLKTKLHETVADDDLLKHFMEFGWKARRNPHPFFDVEYYLSQYGDVAGAGVNPLVHYLEFGAAEGRNPHPFFDSVWYLSRYPDVREAGANPLVHFVLHGMKEMRDPNPLFSIQNFSESEHQIAHLDGLALAEALVSGVKTTIPKLALSNTPLARPRAPEDREWSRVSSKRSKQNATVDIIVPVYKGYEDTLACIFAVLKHRQETDFELIVINDCGPDAELNEKLEHLASKGLFTYLQNETNLGFVQTVNRGMLVHPDREIVLLNSDAIVYSDWLDRLMCHAASDQRIATITPFSNNATVCSYPETSVANMRTLEASLEEIDSYAAICNSASRNVLPSGVGFCFYIRRKALDEVGLFDYETFGRGYGEENDFCMRVAEAGYVNALAHDVFVYHTGELSFSDTAAQSKRLAQIALDAKHPNYSGLVKAYIDSDPSFEARAKLDIFRLMKVLGPNSVIFISHAMGGGIEKHIRELSRMFKTQNVPVLILRVGARTRNTISLELLNSEVVPYLPNAGEMDVRKHAQLVRSLFEMLEPQLIHIHSTVGFSDEATTVLFRAIQESNVPYFYTWHDFAPLCHRSQFVQANRQYCGEPTLDVCVDCFQADPEVQSDEPEPHRRRLMFGALFEKASGIIVPSESAKARAIKLVDAKKIVVRPHFEELNERDWIEAPDGFSLPLRVAIVGAIGPHKGSDILFSMVEDAERRSLPVEFVVIGHTDRADLFQFNSVRSLGKYAGDSAALSALRDSLPHVALFPSICPETYCYTLSVAFRAGIPPVVLGIGALAERVKVAGWGRVLPIAMRDDPAAINDALLNLPVPKLWAERRKPKSVSRLSLSEYYDSNIVGEGGSFEFG